MYETNSKTQGMYHALNQDVSNIEAYHDFIISILENDNQHYKSIFQEIIQQAQELVKLNDIYSINSNRFGIISFLANHKDIIDQIDPDNLKEEDFKMLLKCI